jgi:hypothetical protein
MTTYECIGGPHDGERVPDHGWLWRITAAMELPEPREPWQGEGEPPAVRPGASGSYVQEGRTYRWEPDR